MEKDIKMFNLSKEHSRSNHIQNDVFSLTVSCPGLWSWVFCILSWPLVLTVLYLSPFSFLELEKKKLLYMSHAFFEALAFWGVAVTVSTGIASSTKVLMAKSVGSEEVVVVENLYRDHSYARVLHQLVKGIFLTFNFKVDFSLFLSILHNLLPWELARNRVRMLVISLWRWHLLYCQSLSIVIILT